MVTISRVTQSHSIFNSNKQYMCFHLELVLRVLDYQRQPKPGPNPKRGFIAHWARYKELRGRWAHQSKPSREGDSNAMGCMASKPCPAQLGRRGRQADNTPYHALHITSMRGNPGLLLMNRTVRWVEKTVHVEQHVRGQFVWPWPRAACPADRKRGNAELSRASITAPFVTCHFKRQNTQETPALNRHKPPGRRGNRVVWTENPVVWAEKPGERTK